MATNIELKYKSWNTLPIGKYFELREILDNYDDYEGVEGVMNLLSVLTETDVDTLLDLPIYETDMLGEQARFVFTKIPTGRFGLRQITIDGEKYDVVTDFSKVTTAQYIDFNTFYGDTKKYYCNILTTFIIPHGKKYNQGYDPTELAELFKEKLDIETAERACFFFARWLMNSMKIIQTLYIRSLKKMKKKEMTEEAKEKMEELIKSFQQQKRLLDGLNTLMQ